ELLKGAAVELTCRDVAGHGHERDGIEKRIGERDRQVGRTRTAGGEGRRRAPGDTIENVGHEAGDAFMVHGDSLDIVLTLEERIDELNVAVAAEAKHGRHL